MRKLVIFSGLIICVSLISAPRTFSQVELFGGYSYLHVNNNGSPMGTSANGWEASLALHLLGPLGAEMDYSNHYGISPVPSPTPKYVPELSQMYGPRFNILSLPRVEPFVHALFGTVHGVAEVLPSPGCAAAVCSTTTVRDDPFAMAFGGGINVKATHHIWIRLIQADYLRVNFSNNPQNDTRISTGLVLRFGRW